MQYIWVAFGTGKYFKFYDITSILITVGEPKSCALPVFHALTGCDTTSVFKGKGKISAWEAWKAYEEVTNTLLYLANYPFEHLKVDSAHFQRIQRLIVILYDKSSPLSSINETRKNIE